MAQDQEQSLRAPFSVTPCLRGEKALSAQQPSNLAEGEIEATTPGAPLSVGAEVEQLKRELRRLRAEQAQIERRLLLLELRTRPRVTEQPASPLPEERDANAGSLPPGGPAIV
jgi:hypothetical protein